MDIGLHVRVTTSDLFIRKNEACTMNRKKKEKSVLRKEGNVYVLDLFVRVPPSVTAPIKYKPMGIDAIIKLQMEENKGSR